MKSIGTWSVLYGCDDWKDSEELPQRLARDRFTQLRESPPLRGFQHATYVILADDMANTIDAQRFE